MRFRNLKAGGALVLLLAVAVPVEAQNRGKGYEKRAKVTRPAPRGLVVQPRSQERDRDDRRHGDSRDRDRRWDDDRGRDGDWRRDRDERDDRDWRRDRDDRNRRDPYGRVTYDSCDRLRDRLSRQHEQWHSAHDNKRHDHIWHRQHEQLHERLEREYDRARDRDCHSGRSGRVERRDGGVLSLPLPDVPNDRDRDRDRRIDGRTPGEILDDVFRRLH